MSSDLLWQIPVLIVSMMVYIKFARRFGIVDIPNERSSHRDIVIRGGGVIIYLAVVLAVGLDFPLFLIGISFLAVIGLCDDINEVDSIWRFIIQLLAVFLLFAELSLWEWGWWLILLTILVVGTLNAFNFMDGINGMTGLYGLIFLLSIYFVDILELNHLVALTLSSLLIFGFYNFRSKAVCFAGDVGSLSLSFIIVFLLIQLIVKTGDINFLLMVSVYGVDSVWTILCRLKKSENIFKAHRSHLYQYLANEKGWPHLKVAATYAAAQLVINLLVVYNYYYQIIGWHLLILVLATLSLIYLSLRMGGISGIIKLPIR